MGCPIRTNKLKFAIDYVKLESVYDFFCINTSEKYFKQSATVLDMGLAEKNICSIKYESGNAFFVMLYKAEDNHTKLKSALTLYENNDKISFFSIAAQDLEPSILLQLLINALSWTDNQFLSFNNLTGKLYCFNSRNIKRNNSGEQVSIKQIKCLEISVDKQLCIQLNVRTFTNIKFKNNIKFGKRKFEEYPQYIISNKNTLKRKTKSDDKADAFIMRQFNNTKSEIPFLCLNDIDSFNASKMGVLTLIIQLFEKKYREFAFIDFETIHIYTGIDHKKSEDKLYKEKVGNILKAVDLRIIDKVNSESSAVLISHIQELFKMYYEVNVPVRKSIAKNGMNLAVIHNKDWYEGQADQHLNTSDYALQHITVEDFLGKSDFAVKTIVNELAIKHDLQEGRLTIFDWSALQYPQDWVFALKQEIDDETRYFFMVIHKNGSFEFFEKKLDLFSMDEYNKYALILDDKNTNGIIINAYGEINVIKETGWFTIPQIEQIQQHLQAGDNKLRSKAKEDELLSSCLDIKYMPQNDKIAYYFVGTIGNGMQQKVSDACPIRQIESYRNSSLFFNELLPLMNITFVRNGQLTVLPFPFKFLREWISENFNI